MQRVCSWCQAVLGETCRHCGCGTPPRVAVVGTSDLLARKIVTDRPIGVRLDLYLPPGITMPGEGQTGQDDTYAILNIWQCPVCLRAWIDQLDGKTDGICDPCLKKQKAAEPN